MSIPVNSDPATAPPGSGWTGLAAAAKRERLLSAATDVFTRRGLEAPMSEVADAAGAGVASVYRIFPSKEELLAALVVRRWDEIHSAAEEALRRPGTRWAALTDMLHSVAASQSANDFLAEARDEIEQHPDVAPARERAWHALGRLIAEARAEGRLRSDATTFDVRLLFAATRTARRIDPESWPRMLALMIDAFDRRREPEES